MPLSSPSPRKASHTRTIDCKGYQREDGLWEVDGHLCDTRSFDYSTKWRGQISKGEPYHDVWLRITFGEDMVIRAIEAVFDVAPYPDSCFRALENYQRLVGEHIGAGFAKRARMHIGGPAGCTHVTELLRILGSAAMQTVSGHLTHITQSFTSATEMFGTRGERPAILDSCYSYALDNEIVGILWPEHYAGPRRQDL